MRNIKILGISLLALLSISGVMAVSASADTLTATAYPAVLTGTSDGEFKDTLTTTAGAVSCPDIKYDATITGPVTTAGLISVTPTYPATGCTGFGFPTTIHHKSCVFQFRVLAGTAGTANLECSGSDELTITAISAGITKCTVHVKSQTDIPGTIKFTNTAGGGTVEANLTGIHYTHTQGTGLGACTAGTANNGTLVMKAVFTAETHAGQPTGLLLSS
ncbi:MAG TPA: hypothetical protein VFX85_08705 [Solirubrobacterales bacterium]|nr:hypothetical protein [Solirubrobacterales bacterium]